MIGEHSEDIKVACVKIEQTSLSGVYLLTPKRIADSRGFFAQTYAANELAAAGMTAQFVQDNHSLSVEAGTVRGLHFQLPPRAQTKLVRCGQGALFDVAVDLRKGSPTYGAWYGAELSADNGCQLWIPEGFAHGFVTRAPNTEIIYKCSDYYAPETEGMISWDDPDIAIDWGLDGATPHLSEKDSKVAPLVAFDSTFLYDHG